MTQPKKVATTLKTVLDNPIMTSIMDRTVDMTDIIEEVKEWWNYDLYSRRPGPAYNEDGLFQGTDLDLACFLYALVDRNAVINIPTYKSMRNKKAKEGQAITSQHNRHGQLISLASNQNVFTFSVKIKDMNVMTTDSVGDYRNFSLTDLDGQWYDGWRTIQFMPTAKENNFITENKLWSGNHIIFKNFVHPNRWTSFYGQYYFMTKALIDRLTEESKFYNIQIKRMLNDGIQYPPSEVEKMTWPTTVAEKGKSVKVSAFEVEIDIPNNNTEYPEFESNVGNLVTLTTLRRKYIYNLIPRLRFATRATELAFFKHGKIEDQERFPSWLKDVKWERDYVQTGKRTKWDRLVLFQPGVGERGVSIRKREYQKSETVSVDY